MIVWALASAAEPWCEGSAPCRVVEELPAGAAGVVKHVARFPPPASDDVDPYGPDRDQPSGCNPHEYWLVRPDGTAARVLALCNDGYGASGVGEDQVRVEDGTLTHTQMGGSAWRWDQANTYSLAPLRWTATRRGYGMPLMTWEEVAFDAARFAGSWSVTARVCDGADDEESTWGGPLVPQLDGPPAPWEQVTLGACALALDAATGPLTWGKPGAPDDGRVRVLQVGERELWVEVEDDAWVSKAKSWVFEDHLELWAAPFPTDDTCRGAATPAVQWGIRLDGQVVPAHGQPGPLTVHAREQGGHRAFRILLPDAPDARRFALVYSDSDDGRTQERLLATAPVKAGDGESLGRSWRVPPEMVRCRVTDGRLAPEASPWVAPSP